jgi:hypothetical protein
MTDAPTKMTLDWIKRTIDNNPCRVLEGGNILTCPVRGGFVHLDNPQKAMEDGKPDKYAYTLLFQPGSDISVLKQEMARVGQEKWGDKFIEYVKGDSFHNPIQDQGGKSQYQGFVEGLPCITATGERKPPVVQQNMAPYTGRTYSGQWAMVVIRPFTFETKNRAGAVLKRGLGFGLQSVMIIADDEEFGGGSVDPHKAFAGVKLEANVNASAMFGEGATAGSAKPSAADLL